MRWRGWTPTLALLLVARVVTRNRDWRSDEALYSQTLKVSPRATSIRENLGVVAWNHGNIDGAEKQWRIALNLAPNSPIALTNLGLVYAKRKQYHQAAHYFREAMLHKPDYTDPHLNLGSMEMDLGRYDQAEWQLRAAVALSPLATLWAAGAAWRARTAHPWRAPIAVVCIGNLVAGGAGKTPLAIAVARHLAARGRRPHILSRGYGGRVSGPARGDTAPHAAGAGRDKPPVVAPAAPTRGWRDRAAPGGAGPRLASSAAIRAARSCWRLVSGTLSMVARGVHDPGAFFQ